MPIRRTAEEIAERIVEECQGRKAMDPYFLTDCDPLIVVMSRVADIIRKRKGSFDKPKARDVWCRAMIMLQDDDGGILEHNTCIPCRWCDREFEPVIDDALLALFLVWYESFKAEHLLAIHRCAACGGQLKAKQTGHYEGDYHTPPPGTVEDDEEWAWQLLENESF